jgi:hypothetical protein
MSGGPTVSQTSSSGGSTARITQTRAHRTRDPARLRPRNRTPGAAELAPSSHSAPRHSWLHSPMRVTSASTAHTASGGASTTTSTAPVCGSRRFAPPAGEPGWSPARLSAPLPR